MPGDFDPRDVDSRERDDGIHDREDQWLSLGRGGGGLAKDADEDLYGRRLREINLHWHDLRHEYASRLVEKAFRLPRSANCSVTRRS
jgi:hypothetical protein